MYDNWAPSMPAQASLGCVAFEPAGSENLDGRRWVEVDCGSPLHALCEVEMQSSNNIPSASPVFATQGDAHNECVT